MKARVPVSLNVIRVDQPCPASWDAMHGDDRVRFCGECKLHVYNLSELSRAQAEMLVASHEGRLCVRYYQRADGTVITQDCEGGLRAAMRRTRRFVTAAAGTILCAILAPFGLASSTPPRNGSEQNVVEPKEMMGKPAPPKVLMGDVGPAVQGGIQAPPVMGMVAPFPPATQPTTQPTADPATTQPAE